MDESNPSATKAMLEQTTDVGHFLLPDLGKVQPLFVLILSAQLLVVVQTLLHSSSLQAFDWTYFATASFYVQWNVLLCALVLRQCRHAIQQMPITPGALTAYGLVLLVSLLLDVVVQYLMHAFNSGVSHQWRWDWQASISHLLVVAVIGGIALRYIYLQQRLQIQEQARLRAQIQALQSRIRPHFLFNSMNIVASLIASDPDRAERVVEDISELFRASLRAGDELVPIRDEIKLCRQYISIEQLRLGDRLQVDWQIDEALMEARIPSLSLQPLIENAVYHGIQPLTKGGTVQIIGKLEGDSISLGVINPLPSQTEFEGKDLPRGNRIALANTVARLRAHFGVEANVKTFRSSDRFSAEISYSVKK